LTAAIGAVATLGTHALIGAVMCERGISLFRQIPSNVVLQFWSIGETMEVARRWVLRRSISVLWVAVSVIVTIGLYSACSPQRDTETAALEQYLITVMMLVTTSPANGGGQVSVSAENQCPTTDIELDGYRTVKAHDHRDLTPRADYQYERNESKS
jgi:hypothetical protein